MASKLNWLKRRVIRSDSGFEVSGAIRIGHDIPEPTTSHGKSPFGGIIEKAIAESGAEPGDIVEIDGYPVYAVDGAPERDAIRVMQNRVLRLIRDLTINGKDGVKYGHVRRH